MPTRPLVVSFVGPSGVGKTTLIERLIPVLRANGCRLGTVKHAPHGHDVDRVGSDSWRHRAAGADTVLLAGSDGAVVFVAPPAALSPKGADHHHHEPGPSDALHGLSTLIRTHLANIDVVLAEGYAPVHDVLIVVRRTGIPPKATGEQLEPFLTVTDEPNEGEYHFDQLDEIARRILEISVR